jgi:hypothetical protein
MNDVHLVDSLILVSFVIVTLLTNVLVDKVLEVIKKKRQTNSILSEWSALNVDSIMELLQVCLKAIHFSLETFYQQKEGMTVVSSLSLVVSNKYEVFLTCQSVDGTVAI